MKLLILCQSQFGYHLDTWYYAYYLSNSNKVTYVGWDYDKPVKKIDGVNSIVVPRSSNAITRVVHYLQSCIKTINEKNPDVIFVKYFRLCFLLRVLFPSKQFVFDIRTGDVSFSKFKRVINDSFMKLESFFFKNITIISEGLKIKLNYPKNAEVLPLGAEPLCEPKAETRLEKDENMELLYVGTLSNRNIEDTILGVSKFCKRHGYKGIKYTIVGDGWANELNELKEYVKELSLDGIVDMKGYVHHDNLSMYYDRAHIGVSYVPQTDFFEHQPPTKTYEYLLSGLPVVATQTLENRKLVNCNNGVLIRDNAESFCQGIEDIRHLISERGFKHNAAQYQHFRWSSIVAELESYFRQLVDEKEDK